MKNLNKQVFIKFNLDKAVNVGIILLAISLWVLAIVLYLNL